MSEQPLFKIPDMPLSALTGLESHLISKKNRGEKVEPRESLFYFSVYLQIAEQIPFIYDCVRETAVDGQTLNAGLETLIEMHKAYARHISEQFDKLNEIFNVKGGVC